MILVGSDDSSSGNEDLAEATDDKQSVFVPGDESDYSQTEQEQERDRDDGSSDVMSSRHDDDQEAVKWHNRSDRRGNLIRLGRMTLCDYQPQAKPSLLQMQTSKGPQD